MRVLIGILFLVIIFLILPPFAAAQTPAGYELWWADEFNDTGPISPTDPTRNHDSKCTDLGSGPQCWYNDQANFVRNNQDACTADRLQNSVIENGVLTLRVTEDYDEVAESGTRYACPNNRNYNYVTGGITTRVPRYGDHLGAEAGEVLLGIPVPSIIKFRFRILDVKAGVWPAIWMVGEVGPLSGGGGIIGWPDAGEIDIMEGWGHNWVQQTAGTRWSCTFDGNDNHDCGIDAGLPTKAFPTHWINTGVHRRAGIGTWPDLSTGTGKAFHYSYGVTQDTQYGVAIEDQWVEYEFHYLEDRMETWVDGQRVTRMQCDNTYSGCSGGIMQLNGFFQDASLNNGENFDYDSADPYSWPWNQDTRISNAENNNVYELLISWQFDAGYYGMDPPDADWPLEMEVDYIRVYTPISQSVPAADANGYTAQYQRPILYSGDTLDPTWTGPDAITIPTPAAASPTCSGASGADTGEYWIRGTDGVDQLESAATTYRIIWVCPGNHVSALGDDEIDLARSGASSADGDLIKVMCYGTSDDTQNPVQRNPNWRSHSSGDPYVPNHNATEECILPRLRADSRSNWFFHGVTFSQYENGLVNSHLIETTNGATNIGFNNVWFACYNTATNGTSHDCVRLGIDGTDTDHWIQNSVVGPCTPYMDADMNGVGIARHTSITHIVSNEMLDCGKALFTGNNGTVGQAHSNVVENNDMYFSEYHRFECDSSVWAAEGLGSSSAGLSTTRRPDFGGAQSNLLDPTSECGGGQIFMSLKKGGESGQPMLVINNRIGRGRKNEGVRFMGDSRGGQGAWSISINPNDLIIRNNIVYDMAQGFQVASASTNPGPDFRNIVIEQNVFEIWQGDYQDPTVDNDYRGAFQIYTQCNTRGCLGEDYRIALNTWAPITDATHLDPANLSFASVTNYSTVDFSCNVVQGSAVDARLGGSLTGAENVLVDNPDLSAWSLTDSLAQTTAQANMGDLTFWTRLQTEPQQYTIGSVRATTDSGFIDTCTLVDYPSTDILGVPR